MNELIFSMPWVVAFCAAILFMIVLSLAAQRVTHRFIAASILREHHELAAVTLGVVGVIYAVLLGFIVSSAQDISTRAAAAAEQEAELLIVLNRNASLIDHQLGMEVRRYTFEYVRTVRDHDWPELASRRLPTESRHSLTRLYRAVHAYAPTDTRTSVWYAECVATLNRIADARTERIGSAMTGLGSMLWTLLIAGGALTVSGLFFFSTTHLRLHQVMIAMLSGVVTFLLLVVLDLEHPFAGGLAIEVEPFQRVQEVLSNLPN